MIGINIIVSMVSSKKRFERMMTSKHSLKRYLVFLLVFILVTGSMCVTAFAEETILISDEEVNNARDESSSYPEDEAFSFIEIPEEENADPSGIEVPEEENTDPSGVEVPEEENVDLSAEQSLKEDLIEETPEENVPEYEETDESSEEEPEEESEEEPEEEPVVFDQSCIVNNMVVTVKADPGVFPADAMLSVELVPVWQQEQADTAVEEVRDEDRNVAVFYTFDIKVIDPETGSEYQPAEGQNVSVSFALAEVADDNLETSVYHVTEDESTGELSAEPLGVTLENEVTAVVETDGFSLYTVEFTYNTLEYVLQGDSSVALSEILAAVGLTGEVTDVAVSDAGLFSASNETGEWIVTAHQAFDTNEWMQVTIGGITYEITVTDDIIFGSAIYRSPRLIRIMCWVTVKFHLIPLQIRFRLTVPLSKIHM